MSGDMPRVTWLIVTRSGTKARQPDNHTGDLNHVSVLGKKSLQPKNRYQLRLATDICPAF